MFGVQVSSMRLGSEKIRWRTVNMRFRSEKICKDVMEFNFRKDEIENCNLYMSSILD